MSQGNRPRPSRAWRWTASPQVPPPSPQLLPPSWLPTRKRTATITITTSRLDSSPRVTRTTLIWAPGVPTRRTQTRVASSRTPLSTRSTTPTQELPRGTVTETRARWRTPRCSLSPTQPLPAGFSGPPRPQGCRTRRPRTPRGTIRGTCPIIPFCLRWAKRTPNDITAARLPSQTLILTKRFHRTGLCLLAKSIITMATMSPSNAPPYRYPPGKGSIPIKWRATRAWRSRWTKSARPPPPLP